VTKRASIRPASPSMHVRKSARRWMSSGNWDAKEITERASDCAARYKALILGRRIGSRIHQSTSTSAGTS
jgi:hypothetical protein